MSTEKNPMPIQEKYLLTSHEASIYFNIGIKNMRCLARDRSLKISVKIRGRTLIVRSKFEEYVLSLLEDNPTEDLSVSPLCEVNDFDCTGLFLANLSNLMLMHFLEHKELADVYYSRDGAHYEQVRVESTDQMPRFDGLFVRWYQAVYNFSKHQSCEELQQWTQKPLTFRIWIILQTRK